MIRLRGGDEELGDNKKDNKRKKKVIRRPSKGKNV